MVCSTGSKSSSGFWVLSFIVWFLTYQNLVPYMPFDPDPLEHWRIRLRWLEWYCRSQDASRPSPSLDLPGNLVENRVSWIKARLPEEMELHNVVFHATIGKVTKNALVRLLAPDGWINDELIDLWVNHLRQQAGGKSVHVTVLGGVHVASSFFLSKLLTPDYCRRRLDRWFKVGEATALENRMANRSLLLSGYQPRRPSLAGGPNESEEYTLGRRHRGLLKWSHRDLRQLDRWHRP